MKKNVVLFLTVFVLCSCVFATENNQKILPVDSQEYEAISYLYIIQGKALPSTTGPYSENELKNMLDQIDGNLLPTSALSTYSWVKESLYDEPKSIAPNFEMNFDLDVNLETYYHTNTTNFLEKNDWNYDWLDQKPFIHMGWETWAAKNFYGYFEFDFRNSLHTQKYFGSTNFITNIASFQNLEFQMEDMNVNFPYRAFISTGNDNWSLQLGRDRLNWGAGKTGNLAISDNLIYHNMVKFTTYCSKYKYTFLTSFFPHPMNYFKNGSLDLRNYYSQVLEGTSMYIAHRMEGRFFNDKLSFTVTEGIMYMTEDNTIYPMIFNPVMFYHNNYIRDLSNSTLVFEFDYTPIKNVNIYGQLISDEFHLPVEETPGEAEHTSPSALGCMLGLNFIYPVKDGILYSSLENVKTDPFLYLRYKFSTNGQTAGEYGLNYVVAVRNYFWPSKLYGDRDVMYDAEFLGYKYGGDAEVVNLNIGYKKFSNFYIEGNIFYMAHGTFDKWTCWSEVTNGDDFSLPLNEDCQTPTSSHEKIGNSYDGNAYHRNAVSHTLIIGINGGCSFGDYFSAFAQFDFINIVNYLNLISNGTVQDFQATVGISYSL